MVTSHELSTLYIVVYIRGLPRWLSGKESACNAGAAGVIPRSGRSPGGGHGNPLQYSCHGQRSLAGYIPQGCNESDSTGATWYRTAQHSVCMAPPTRRSLPPSLPRHPCLHCTFVSSSPAWKIPWTEEPGGLQSMGSRRVRHD